MKKIVLFFMMMLLAVTGCSVIEEGKNSLDYANEAVTYIDHVGTFAGELTTLAQDAVNDEAARKELETKLQDLQKESKAFNELTPPDFAKDIHQQIVDYNNQLNELIDSTTKNIEEGKANLADFQNSELMQTVQQLQDLKTKVENLGQ
ncbi:hypothetical protein BAMA_19450 [Bacillus manliponensis]|uniref:Lipoprotein n=1 Tax=Bacillus manliponensis TaxID=574376 RepID=A0A073KCF4_9BACI|nr:DUF6376 family protein [Bacillus manliponensis]KEK19943.1 hypothetical protein BAMA_19450 [Bacillus manliponensis]